MSLAQPQLRELITSLLRSDSDLDAFCSDYFPEVFRRYTIGMDRVHKVTLLLQYVDAEQLTQLLSELQAKGPSSRPPAVSRPVKVSPTRLIAYRWAMAGGVLLLMALVTAWVLQMVLTPPSQAVLPGPSIIQLKLDSVPQGANVTRWDRNPNEPVAETPFDKPISRPKGGILVLQLEKSGYKIMPLTISIEADAKEVNQTIVLPEK